VIKLRDQFFGGKGINGASGGTVVDSERNVRFRKMLPDELEHEQLVKIGVEQRTSNRVEFPVVVVRPLREVDDHSLYIFIWRRAEKQMQLAVTRIGPGLSQLGRREHDWE